jgi:hypothetical protein
MKNKINSFILTGFMLIILGTFSCTSYLDRTPESIINENEVFKNFTNFQGFVEEMYMLLPDIAKHTWVSSFNWGDDEQQYDGDGRYFAYHVDRGDFRWYINANECFLDRDNLVGENPMNGRMGRSIWKGSWYGIRKCNLGLDALDKGLMIDATQEERNMVAGQLYFFRGFFHFQLMQYWGGMPYIDHVLGGDKLDLPRLSYSECADKAGEDLRKAADLLPINWDNTAPGRRTIGNNELRANKIWALGYLGKNYLWAGSPLMAQGATGTETYDASYCKKAAEALAEIINLVETGQTQYSLVNFSNYSDLFYTFKQGWRIPGSTEAIMRGPSYEGNSQWRQSQSYYPGGAGSPGAGGDPQRLYPAANYVNFFGMKNGLPLNDPASGFNPNQPWKDRDPRFYSDFIYDGLKVISASLSPDQSALWTYANLYTGGSYRAVNTSPNVTGYCLRKFIPLSSNDFDKGGDYGNNLNIMLTWLRLADVYIMYSEAAAEGYASPTGKDPSTAVTAADAINRIRDRAGVDHVNSKYLGSLDAFMGEVRRERAVELAFEGFRFNDLRRWLLLTKAPYTIKTSQEFDRNGTFNEDDPTVNQVRNFREAVVWERKLDSKHYWLPIKNDDVYLYPGFPQNPGW